MLCGVRVMIMLCHSQFYFITDTISSSRNSIRSRAWPQKLERTVTLASLLTQFSSRCLNGRLGLRRNCQSGALKSSVKQVAVDLEAVLLHEQKVYCVDQLERVRRLIPISICLSQFFHPKHALAVSRATRRTQLHIIHVEVFVCTQARLMENVRAVQHCKFPLVH